LAKPEAARADTKPQTDARALRSEEPKAKQNALRAEAGALVTVDASGSRFQILDQAVQVGVKL
jgi:hypothetical protein